MPSTGISNLQLLARGHYTGLLKFAYAAELVLGLVILSVDNTTTSSHVLQAVHSLLSAVRDLVILLVCA